MTQSVKRLFLPLIVTVTVTTILSILSTAGCVAKYPPLKKIDPLSGDCDDYAEFSVAILKQRDQGFTKRATINIAGFSVGSEVNRKTLYKSYKPMIEVIFADYLITTSAARATGRTLCRHKLDQSWDLILNEQFKEVAGIVRVCQRDNDAEVDIEKCVLTQAKGGHNLDVPPLQDI